MIVGVRHALAQVRDMLVRVRDMLAALHSILTTSTIAARLLETMIFAAAR